MEVVLLCLSLLVQHGLAQEPCKCLDQRLCEDSAGCGYRCRAGFAGKYCSQVNLGFNISLDAPEIFDGDFSTCRNDGKSGRRITFKHSIDIDKIRIHRKNNETSIFYAFLYKSSKSFTIWNLPQYKMSTEGAATVASFPLQTGVTAIWIDGLGTACEVELTNEQCSSGCAGGCDSNWRCDMCKPGWTHSYENIPLCDRNCSGYYGPGCRQRCSSGCSGNNCDSKSGTCPCKTGWRGHKCEECGDGHYGPDCSGCSDGCSDTCNKTNGDCTCKAGWRGADCSQECPRGRYGLNCSSSCSPGCRYGLCEPIAGECFDDTCYAGWKNLKGSPRRCDEKCASGTYGSNCSMSCSDGCEDANCHHVSGNCNCTKGRAGESCTRKCTSVTYGSYCSLSCSKGCKGGTCHHVSGNCTCTEGWRGPRCAEKCKTGYYGQDCDSRCSERCEDTCDHVTGTCTCSPGWSGTHCSHVCQAEHYGSGCVQICSLGCKYGECNHVDGSCVCKPGLAGETCSIKTCSPGCADECDVVDHRCHRCKPGWTHSNTSDPLCDEALEMKENKGCEIEC